MDRRRSPGALSAAATIEEDAPARLNRETTGP